MPQEIWSYGGLYDKERLERVQITNNVSMFEHIVEESHNAAKPQPNWEYRIPETQFRIKHRFVVITLCYLS